MRYARALFVGWQAADGAWVHEREVFLEPVGSATAKFISSWIRLATQ